MKCERRDEETRKYAKAGLSGALHMAEYNPSGSPLPSWELSQRVQWAGWSLSPTSTHWAVLENQEVAQHPYQERRLLLVGFPNFLAPQPGRQSHELAVVFAKPPA